MKALDQEARSALRKHGVRFGQFTIFLPALLKPAPTRLRLVLWSLANGLQEFPESPPPGLVTIPNLADVPKSHYTLAGYHPAGARAIRIDMLERLADLLRAKDSRAGFEATPDMLSITGMTLEQFADLMGGLGYKGEKAERPKAKPETAVSRMQALRTKRRHRLMWHPRRQAKPIRLTPRPPRQSQRPSTHHRPSILNLRRKPRPWSRWKPSIPLPGHRVRVAGIVARAHVPPVKVSQKANAPRVGIVAASRVATNRQAMLWRVTNPQATGPGRIAVRVAIRARVANRTAKAIGAIRASRRANPMKPARPARKSRLIPTTRSQS